MTGPGIGIVPLQPSSRLERLRADCVREELGFLWTRMTGGLATSKWKRMRVGVCATFPEEGATTLAANCAIYLAEHGKSTVLLESNLRRPSLANHFGVERAPGFWELMEGTAPAGDGVLRPLAPNLQLVPAGGVPPKFSPELDDAKLDHAVRFLDQRCDVMVFDLPPLAACPETLALLSHVDWAMLVVRADHTAKRDVKRSVRALQERGVPLVGTVLNDCRHEVPTFLAKVP